MNPLTAWWTQICVPLDGLLWKKGITHGTIRPLLRNQILASGGLILSGGLCYVIWPWIFWAACGFLFMTFVFISWTRFFLFSPDKSFRNSIPVIVIRFLSRLFIFAILLYVCMRYFAASAISITMGVMGAVFWGLFNFAYYMRKGG